MLSELGTQYIQWNRMELSLAKMELALDILRSIPENKTEEEAYFESKIRLEIVGILFGLKSRELNRTFYPVIWKEYCKIVSWAVKNCLDQFKKKWKKRLESNNSISPWLEPDRANTPPWFVLACIEEPGLLDHKDLCANGAVFDDELFTVTVALNHDRIDIWQIFERLNPNLSAAIIRFSIYDEILPKVTPVSLKHLTLSNSTHCDVKLIQHLVNLESYTGPIDQDIFDFLIEHEKIKNVSVVGFDSNEINLKAEKVKCSFDS